ncbi:hypothetical protein [Actinomyces faecalis]|uniref:hypothetical protein n=1 Tax=Actinomyces faecalis TaxID=2722820 RepID=UPI0015579153|nr:hypothetical protein [Actinomyces faecalis]
MLKRTFHLTIGTRTWRVPMEHWYAVYDQVDAIWQHGHGGLWFPTRNGRDVYVFIDRTTPVTLHG